MSLEAAIERLYSFIDNERLTGAPVYGTTDLDLDRFRALLAKRGNRHREFRSVHIAGSKGKGSTAAMLDSILRANGVRTGLYTSPHLIDLRERIRVDGRCVDATVFATKLDELTRIAVEASAQRSFRTVFEILTATAFEIFAEAGVEIAVVEVGMGGRLDATNVIDPSLSVITPIGLDHLRALGGTIEKIASEKAGILRRGVPLLLSLQSDAAHRVIRARADEVGAGSVVEIGKDWRIANVRADCAGTTFDLRGQDTYYKDLRTPLLGRFQAENAACAVAAAHMLDADEAAIRSGLSNVVWPARMQLFPQDKFPKSDRADVVVDGAHSPMAFERIIEALAEIWPDIAPVWVFAANHDKDIPSMLDILASRAGGLILTTFDWPRAASPAKLASLAPRADFPVRQMPDVHDALAAAAAIAGPNGLIVVAGSLYLAGEALSELRFSPCQSAMLGG